MAKRTAAAPTAAAEMDNVYERMAAIGFKPATDATKPRIVCSVRGRAWGSGGGERTGKTTLALTAPAPIAYFNFDIGTEGVLSKVVNAKGELNHGRKGKVMTLDFALPPKIEGDFDYRGTFERFADAHMKCIEAGVRTIVWDTESEAWELLRIAEFGRLEKIPPYKYTNANSQYRALVRAVYESDTNLIMIHKTK